MRKMWQRASSCRQSVAADVARDVNGRSSGCDSGLTEWGVDSVRPWPLVAAVGPSVGGRPGNERLSDLPVVAEGILDPAETPAMLFTYWIHLAGARRLGPLERGVRIVDDQQHPHRASAHRLWAEICVRR